MKRKRRLPVIIASLIVVGACVLCLIVAGVAGFAYFFERSDRIDANVLNPFKTPVGTPQVIRPTPLLPTHSEGQGMQLVHPGFTLEALENTTISASDLPELARRLGGVQEIPETLEQPLISPQVGTQWVFWATNLDNTQPFQVSATLGYLTDRAYFWIQDDISFREEDLETLAETFEHEILPTNIAFFGRDWRPGGDQDTRLHVLYTRGLGRNLAGYFSSADRYHPAVHPYANAMEIFFLNADNLDLASKFTYSVLAHELQHMIHWHLDRNEETWLNEGFSELAAFINGYNVGGFDRAFASNPDIQLNDWPVSPGQSAPHYGASFLFLVYFLDRLGEQATQALVAHPDNGLMSVDQVLADPRSMAASIGETITADDFFLDWVLANYLNDESIADGRFFYANYPDLPSIGATETVRFCPAGPTTRDVHQYGVNYIRITCRGDYALNFEGSIQTTVVPAEPYFGNYAFWSNRGDESHMTLTRFFDFSEHHGPLTLEYRAWFDIEKDYDYVYLTASTGGDIWEILRTPSGTSENPSGNNFGWGYNGMSGEGADPLWIREEVDLSSYAGEQVYLRFEYVTDAAVHGDGFLLDDVAIPEIGYFTDFEVDDGGWEADGWVRIDNNLPQSFSLALITIGDSTQVEYISTTPDNTAWVPISISSSSEEVVFVVTGATRYTRQKAAYRFSIHPGNP